MTADVLIQFKLSPGLVSMINEVLASGFYANRTEFLRDAVRTRLEALQDHGLARKLRAHGRPGTTIPTEDLYTDHEDLSHHVQHWNEHRSVMGRGPSTGRGEDTF